MLVSSVVHCIAVLIFQLWGVHTLSLVPVCPASCVCETSFLVNCASLGLSNAPSHIPATATVLDLSHNALLSLAPLSSGHVRLRGLQHLWLGNNSLESLSMCLGMTRRKQRCVSWTPDLQSLSADRNQLKLLPRGLANIKSLKVLQLSHNSISEIGPGDLAGCTHLSELHLQHNVIDTIHPEAFKDLQNLKVLDVSYNLLAVIPVPAYMYLRNLNVLSHISGNRWRCDCNLKTIKRWISFDRELGNRAWEVVCFSPSQHAGKDLLYLEESDLACPQPVYNTHGVKKELTVDEGMEFILYCNTTHQDFIHTRWWTPHGQIFHSQQFLYIRNTTVHDAGLYVCISGFQEEYVSVFNLRVRKRAQDRRLRRDAQTGWVGFDEENIDSIQRIVPAAQTVPQSQFVIAVCLSVFVTLIVAFVLGVLLRPLLEKCYKQIQNKRNSTRSHSNSQNSPTGQRPYVNEGYSDTDDQDQEVHERPRVTFGGVTEIQDRGGVPYYVTVEDSPSGSNTDVVVEKENLDKKESLTRNTEVHKEVPLRKENEDMPSQRSTEVLNVTSSKEMQFEYIPDPEDTTQAEERSISPASSLSDERNEPQMCYKDNESTEQSVDSQTLHIYEEYEEASTDDQSIIPGLIADPFTLKMSESKEESVDDMDPDLWNDSGDSFSFTEGSPRSSSRVSHVAALGYPINQKEMSVDEPSDRPSSRESGESKKGPMEYTEDDEDSETQITYLENDINYCENRLSPFENQKTSAGAQFRQDTITLDPTDMYITYTQGDSFDDEQFTEYNECCNSSNTSSDYEDEPTQYHVHPVYRSSQKTTILVGEDISHTCSCREEDEDKQEDYSKRPEVATIRDSFLGQIPVSFDEVPKIKRYVQFSQSEPQLARHFIPSASVTQVSRPVGMSKTEADPINIFYEGRSISLPAIPQVQRYVHFTELEPPTVQTLTPTINGDGFLGGIPVSFDKMPKVNSYIQFSQSEPELTRHAAGSPSVTQDSRPVVMSKTEIQSDTINIYFEGQGVSLPTVPKVQNYVQFTQLEPQSVHKLTSTIKGDSFLGHIPVSVDEVPKIKRYVQFSQSEPQLTCQTAALPSVTQVSRPVGISNTNVQSDIINIFFEGRSISLPAIPQVQRFVQFTQTEPQTIHKLTPTIKGGSFLQQIPVSYEDVPKIKRYVQFSRSEPQLTRHLIPSASVTQVSRPVVISKTEAPSDRINIYFVGQSVSLPTVPKVQNYVQFTQLEPQTVHKLTPTIKGDNFIGKIPVSVDEMPKVNRYIQFSQSEPQLTHHLIPSASVTQVSRPVGMSKTEADPINIFYEGRSISLPAIPQVQRYVHFTELEPQTVQKSTSTINGDGFLGGIPVSVDKVPKVNSYIQFSQSEPELTRHAAASPSITQDSRPMVMSKTEAPSDTINIFFEGQSISLPAVPQVQNYVQFTQLEPQAVHKLTSTIKGDSFLGHIPVSVDEVPKIKRYVQFSQSEPQLTCQTAALPSVTQVSRPVGMSKTEADPINIFYEGRSISLPAIPQVQRYVHFTELEPQTVQKSTSTINGDGFLGGIPVSVDKVPKVNHYIQFSQSEPELTRHAAASPSITQDSRPMVMSKTEAPSDTINIFFEGQSISLPAVPQVQRYVQFKRSEPQTVERLTPTIKGDGFLGHIPISVDEVPKVKRHILFSQVESHYPTLTLCHVSKEKYSLTDEQKTSLVTKVHDKPEVGDNFFAQMDGSLNCITKVKKYIQFTQSEVVSKRLSPYVPLNENVSTMQTGTELKSNNSLSKDYNEVADEHNFIGRTGMVFNGIPKVKRRIQFTEHSPQLPKSKPLSPLELAVRPAVTAVTSPHPTSDIKPNFFKPNHTSLDNIPKVKRALQFTQIEAEPSNRSILSFFGQTDIPFVEVPKVKRYLQVIKSEPSAESPITSVITESVTPESSRKIQSERSKAEVSPSIKGDNFFGQTGSSVEGVPKVKRYIQFTEAEPHFQPPLLHPLPRKTEKKDLTSERFIQPAAGEHMSFGAVGTSFKIPKVRRYIQFSQHSTQPPSLPLYRQTSVPVLTKPDLRRPGSSPVDSRSDNGDTFFKKMDASVSELPRVKRYIQFTQQYLTPPKSSNTHRVTVDVTGKRELWGSDLSMVHIKPPVTKGQFFDQLATNLNSLPRVNRYIQFTQTEPYSSSQSQSPNEEMSKKEWPTSSLSTNNEAKSSTKDTFFDGVCTSLDNIPKVKKALQFTQTEYQDQTAAYDNSSNAADHLFGSLDVPFNQLPEVQFVQTEPNRSSLFPSKFSSREKFLEREQTFPFKEKLKFTTKEKDLFERKDGVPRLTRYTQFTQSEPKSQTSSISSQKWERTDVETESRTFEDVKPATAGDHVLQRISTRTSKPFTSTDSDQYDQIQAQSFSQIQDTPYTVKVITETSRLNQLPEPKRSSKREADEQSDQVFSQVEEVFRQKSFNFSSDDKKYANTHRLSSRTEVSTTETILKSTMSSLSSLSKERALQPGKHEDVDSALQDVSRSIPDTLASSSEKDDAREYLRDSSLARQRQERRKLLFQQKKRAMDGFSLSSESFPTKESDQ